MFFVSSNCALRRVHCACRGTKPLQSNFTSESSVRALAGRLTFCFFETCSHDVISVWNVIGGMCSCLCRLACVVACTMLIFPTSAEKRQLKTPHACCLCRNLLDVMPVCTAGCPVMISDKYTQPGKFKEFVSYFGEVIRSSCWKCN